MLNTVIQHFHRAAPIQPERVAVLFCLPLTQKRFNVERKPIFWINRILGKRHKDFIVNAVPLLGLSWEAYQAEITAPAFCLLKKIESETKTTVIPDATFLHFKDILFSGRFDVVFIITHRPDVIGKMHLEFADGAYSIDEITKHIKKLKTGRVSLPFLVCNAEAIKLDLYGKYPGLESVLFPAWKVPLFPTLEFVFNCVSAFDGKTTLPEAWHKATLTLIQDQFPDY